MITDPTSPMTDESRLVTVWVSRVRTRVTSLERRDTSSPTRCWPWKSSESVTSRPYSSPRSWATTRSPTTPSSQVWMKLPTAWMQNSPIRSAMSRSRSAESPPPDHLAGDPGDDQREQEPDDRAHQQADDRDREDRELRPQVAEEPRPWHASEAAHLADDVAGIGGHTGELLGHATDDGRVGQGASWAGTSRLRSVVRGRTERDHCSARAWTPGSCEPGGVAGTIPGTTAGAVRRTLEPDAPTDPARHPRAAAGRRVRRAGRGRWRGRRRSRDPDRHARGVYVDDPANHDVGDDAALRPADGARHRSGRLPGPRPPSADRREGQRSPGRVAAACSR